jgi:2-polyprenyl-6-methoxyphenol hydroxylase-like FAD-dependent oxidoreductase
MRAVVINSSNDIIIVGGGIAGLTLGLCFHDKGIPCRILEKATEIKPLGVGINVLPHATRVLHELGLGPALDAVAIRTREASFFNRFGQLIYTDPLGTEAGYATPQYSVHRGDLQQVLVDAFVARAGGENLITGVNCLGAVEEEGVVSLHLEDSHGRAMPPMMGRAVVACDGIHSNLRKQLHPEEGAPRYSGYNMWRGVTCWPAILSGATMIRAGWLETGKMVIYPIRDNIDTEGSQLVNWVAELARPLVKEPRDWNKPGKVEDFIAAYEDWRFDWLDVPGLIRGAEVVLDFPMVDQDPLPFWTRGRMTLMGDAAHPMVPRGSNGAGQAILDAECMANLLAGDGDPVAAFKYYEEKRLDATAKVVLINRVAPPDILIKEVIERTGDKPFENIDDVITGTEMAEFQQRYKEVSGYDLATLKARAGE